MSVNLKLHMSLYLDFGDSGSSNLAYMCSGHAVRLGHSVGGLFSGATVEYHANLSQSLKVFK